MWGNTEMRKIFLQYFIYCLLILLAIPSQAQELGKSFNEKLREKRILITAPIEECNDQIEQLCKDAGEDTRDILLCLADHETSLSSECKQGAMNAATLMMQAGLNLDKAIITCEKDIDTFCRNVELGENRIIKCLRNNESHISKQCISTLKETGFWNPTNKGIWELRN